MSDEKIVIEVQDKIDASIAVKLAKIEALSNRGAIAVERLKAAQTRTETATERLSIAQNRNQIALQQLAKNTDQAALAHLRLEAAQKRAQNAANRMEQTHKSVGNSLSSMVGKLAAVAAAYVGVREVLSLANAYVDLENKLRVVTTSQEQLAQVSTQVFDIANRTRTPVEETAKAFSRFDLALIQLGASQAETLRMTETVNKALIVSGANTGEQAAALLQLSQAFNKGKLDGDEFRSVMELMPPVADAIAKQMGVTRGELLKLAPQGKITAEIMKKAFEKASIRIDASFAKTVPTLNQSLEVLKNQATDFFGEIEKGSGSLTSLATFVNDFANALPYFSGNVSALASSMSDLGSEILSLGPSSSTSMGIMQYAIVSVSYATAGWADLIRVVRIGLSAYNAVVLEASTKTNELAIQFLKLTVINGKTVKLLEEQNAQIRKTVKNNIDNANATLMQEGAVEKLEARLEKAGEASDKLRKQQESLKPLNAKISELATKYTELEDSITNAKKAGKAFAKPELKAKTAELVKLRAEYDETKKKRDALLGNSNLRGASTIEKKLAEESEKARKKRLALEAGVEIKHPEKFKPTDNTPLAESSRSVVLGKINDELGREWSLLQRVGSEQESYNRLQQIINDLDKEHVAVSADDIAIYKAKTDALIFQNKVNQEANTISQATVGQQEQLKAKVQALNNALKADGSNAATKMAALYGDMFSETDIALDIELEKWRVYYDELAAITLAGITKGNQYKILNVEEQLKFDKILMQGKAKGDKAISTLDKNSMENRLKYSEQFFGDMSSLQKSSSREMFEIGKASALAQAVISGILQIQKAGEGIPYPYNIALKIAAGVASGANIAQIASTQFQGYAKGGEILGGQQTIRVNEQGTETVMNAGATARNRPILAAMNAGATVGTGTTLSVKIENYGTSKQFEVQKDDDNNIRIIARDEARSVVRTEVPKVVSSEIANPNSSTSKSLAQNTNVTRRH